MTKNNRKRANPPKKQEVKEKPPVTDSFDTQAPLRKYPVKPISQYHANLMQDIVKLSNKFGQTVKQQSDREIALQKMEILVKKLENGKIKPPILVKENDNIFTSRYDIKDIIKDYKHDIKIVRESLVVIEGQTSHWYDEYRDSIVRLYQMLEGFIDKDNKPKNITGQRQSMDGKMKQEEEEIFTTEFEKKIEDLTSEDKEKIKKAMKVNDASKDG